MVGFLFMDLVCGGGLCNDGDEAVIVILTSGFMGCGWFFFGCDLSSDYGLCCKSGFLWVVDLQCCGLVVVCLAI